MDPSGWLPRSGPLVDSRLALLGLYKAIAAVNRMG